jgi:hypothetical protein
MSQSTNEPKVRFLVPSNWRALMSFDDRLTLQDWLTGETVGLRTRMNLLCRFVCDDKGALVGEAQGRKILGALVGEETIAEAFDAFMEAFTHAIVPPSSGGG